MDGPWQIGHKTADEYGRLAAETARPMRMIDPSVRLVACGSSGSGMPTFGDWESTVLAHAYDEVDYLSLHAYYEPPTATDQASYLASAHGHGAVHRPTSSRLCDHGARPPPLDQAASLSFDEWNIWYMSRPAARPGRAGRARRGCWRTSTRSPTRWCWAAC